MATLAHDLFGDGWTPGGGGVPAEAGLYAGVSGLVPDTLIRTLILRRHIVAHDDDIRADQIQPASLDLRLGREAYRIRGSFLPRPGEPVLSKLQALADHRIDLTGGAVLEKGCVYLVPLAEKLQLPPLFSASANPKSSTGRLDVFTRLVVDGGDTFDTVPAGYSGHLYAEISPATFSLKVRSGSRLIQMRFRRRNSQHPRTPTYFLSDTELERLDQRLRSETGSGLVDGGLVTDNGLILSVALARNDKHGRIGFRARRYAPPIDFDLPDALDPADYWEPIHEPRDRRLILDPHEFYILSSREAVHVPPDHAAEMVPIDPMRGEFRVHYAGFFDPGFGHSPAGGGGSRAVLEVRSHEVPFVLEDAQAVGRLRYEKLVDLPARVYGRDIGSHYQAQGLKLSKHFRAD